MQFSILHRTSYRYRTPVSYTIQWLRLTLRDEPQQRTLRWSIDAPAPLAPMRDAYGNAAHLLTVTRPHTELEIVARGEVVVEPLEDGRLAEIGALPPLAYALATRLTEADEAVRAFAARWLRAATAHGLLDFACAIRDAVAYEPGSTDVCSTAAQALALARGVCQDHAHLFIAGCRANGIAARYVSGYIHPGDAPHAASHAWADAWVEGEGWVSIDVTHGRFASDHLCRLAVGRDYDSAAPVRGMRVGGSGEQMSAGVNIRALACATGGAAGHPADHDQ